MWVEEFTKVAMDFISGKKTEIEWINYFDEHKSKHHFELYNLMQDYRIYSIYISLLSVKNRRRLLLDYYSTRFTRKDLEASGISSKRVGKFARMDNKNDDEVACKFLCLLSLLCRVPLHWLTEEYVYDDWDNELLYQMPKWTVSQFHTYLAAINENTREIKGFRLDIDGQIFRLRVEVIFGAYVIEFIHNIIEPFEASLLSKLFKDLIFSSGFMHTVIPNRLHRALFSSYKASCHINPPIEFYSDCANWPHTPN